MIDNHTPALPRGPRPPPPIYRAAGLPTSPPGRMQTLQARARFTCRESFRDAAERVAVAVAEQRLQFLQLVQLVQLVQSERKPAA